MEFFTAALKSHMTQYKFTLKIVEKLEVKNAGSISEAQDAKP